MHTSLAGLQCTVLAERAPAPAMAVVLCHGYGAPGDDLVGLYSELLELAPRLNPVRFYFPEAPLSMGYGARAWWPIDFGTVEAAMAGDAQAIRRMAEEAPEGMDKARAHLLKLVDEISVQTKLPVGRVVLGGFSQGAMITTDVTLRLEEAPAGLVILSGMPLTREVWAKKAKARAGLRVFQAHGRHDPLLAFSWGQTLESMLRGAGLEVDFVPFDGGHQIDRPVLQRLAEFLEKRLDS